MKKFDYNLDLLRVLSMFLVIVIHVANYYCRAFSDITNVSYFFAVLFNALARVSVPIFFMISGALILSKKFDMKKHLKRIKRLLVTLIVFTVIYFIWDKFYMDKQMPSIISLIYTPERSMLWFMYAIITLYIATPFIKVMVDNMDEKLDKLFVILWLITSGGAYLLKIYTKMDFDYLIPIVNGTYYLGYYIIGNMIIKYKDKIDFKKYNKTNIVLCIISILIITLLTYFISIDKNYYYSLYLAYRSILYNILSIGSFLLIYFNIPNKENKMISFISPYSFGIYLVHGMILNVVMNLIDYQNVMSLIGIPFISIILFVIAFIFVYLLKKIPVVKDYL